MCYEFVPLEYFIISSFILIVVTKFCLQICRVNFPQSGQMFLNFSQSKQNILTVNNFLRNNVFFFKYTLKTAVK